MKNENPTQNRIAHLLERMTLLEKYILICRLSYLVGKGRLVVSLKQLPNLILTPDGILFNRRKTNRFVFPERRLARIIRIKIAVWLLDFNDTDPTTP